MKVKADQRTVNRTADPVEMNPHNRRAGGSATGGGRGDSDEPEPNCNGRGQHQRAAVTEANNVKVRLIPTPRSSHKPSLPTSPATRSRSSGATRSRAPTAISISANSKRSATGCGTPPDAPSHPRRAVLRLPANWPWAGQLTAAFARLRPLRSPAPNGLTGSHQPPMLTSGAKRPTTAVGGSRSSGCPASGGPARRCHSPPPAHWRQPDDIPSHNPCQQPHCNWVTASQLRGRPLSSWRAIVPTGGSGGC